MSDLDIIKQLEKKLKSKFKKVGIDETVDYTDIKKTAGYTVNNNNQVTKLMLANFHLEKFPPQVFSLKNLTHLVLYENDIKDISFIKKLKQISTLEISFNQISNISPLKDLKQIKNLDLASNKISDISPLRDLKQIMELTLSFNQISDISPLKDLKQITALNLSYNNIRDSSPLKGLKELKKLNLSSNNISDISTLKDLKQIPSFTLSFNHIKDISPLKSLKQITHVNLYSNAISDISHLKDLKQIKLLFLGANQIIDITPLKCLKELNFLDLSSNKISDISTLMNLKNLSTLDLASNPIKKLPAWIADFEMGIYWKKHEQDYRGANDISFYKNPIETPPIDIVKQGKKAIIDYFEQIEKEKGKTQYLFEVKLLVIGEGSTGKTTFAEKIKDVDADMPEDKDTTLGINVSKWNYPEKIPKIRGLGEVKFYVNLWDFGGQKLYQGTHQIFFSEKSFYVLVAETREETTDFSYWLNTVEQLAGKESSLLIVINTKHGRAQKFDETGFRSHFGKLIKDVIELDLKNDRVKILDLQETVKLRLKHLPGIGDPLPPSWISIREDLLKEKKNFISFDQFRDICSKHNISEPGMIHTLSGYFNRIGAFTHYIDDPILCERIYLNSNWLIKTVYKILDDETVKSKNGRLTENDVKEIWHAEKLHFEVNQLTQLMHKFGLMYHIPNTKEYVVPAHLPTTTPYEEWKYSKADNVLQFIYKFDKYMPKGIMSRLIVALNQHIENHDYVWHKGVNIAFNGTNAEIKETYGGENLFKILIAGTNKGEMLAIIREHFAEVLEPFKNLNYEQLVPCICSECKNSPEPGFHNYNRLLKWKEKGTASQCKKSGEMVNVAELLKITEFKIEESKQIKKQDRKMKEKTIKLFLASSGELKHDRDEVEKWTRRENKKLLKKGIYLDLDLWEDFLDAMSNKRKQDDYNKAVEECDVFISLFGTKVGKYTEEEFETAYKSFKEKNKPKYIYTYFKGIEVNIDNIDLEDITSLKNFQKKISDLGHFYTRYKSTEDLLRQLGNQLDKILEDMDRLFPPKELNLKVN